MDQHKSPRVAARVEHYNSSRDYHSMEESEEEEDSEWGEKREDERKRKTRTATQHLIKKSLVWAYPYYRLFYTSLPGCGNVFVNVCFSDSFSHHVWDGLTRTILSDMLPFPCISEDLVVSTDVSTLLSANSTVPPLCILSSMPFGWPCCFWSTLLSPAALSSADGSRMSHDAAT